MTPFQALYGRKRRIPFQALYGRKRRILCIGSRLEKIYFCVMV